MPDVDALTTIANIIDITGGSLAIAELIRQWYLAWRKGKAGKQIDKVVIYDGEDRHLLKNRTSEEIARILEAL